MSDLKLIKLSSGTILLKNTVMAVNTVDPNALFGASTGWLSGGFVTISGSDPAKFDVSAGTGMIVDASDPANITATPVSWNAMVAVTLDNLATQAATFLAIDVNGTLIQASIFPVANGLRDCIQIGGMTHGNNTTIAQTTDFTSPMPTQLAPALTDLIVALGVIKTSGNVYFGSAAVNLRFDKSVGSSFYFGINAKIDPNNPNNSIDAALSEPDILFSWRDGSGGFNTAVAKDITASVYDDNTGGIGAPSGVLNPNKWVNCKIHYSPDFKGTVIEYGSTAYNSSTEALAGLSSDFYGNNQSFVGVPVMGYLSLKSGAIDTSDGTEAIFTTTDKLGLI